MAVIGPADEFWRLRVIRVDVEGEPDLEWRDDVLYRAPAPERVPLDSEWRVEAVRLDDDVERVIGAFETESDAREFLEAARDDLRDMTAKQFEERYDCR